MIRAAAGGLLLLLLACLLGTSPAFGEAESGSLTSFIAEYRLSRDGIPVARTQVSLQLLPGGGYFYRARTEPNAVVSLIREELILEESRGRMVNGRPRPDRYLYRREGEGIQRELRLEFDWPHKRLRISDDRSSWRMGIDTGTLDKLVQQLVYTRELGEGRKSARYRVADGGRLKEYAYRVLGKETVTTPLGRFETLKVERTKEGGKSDYTLWLAPQLDHRPVQIRRRHEGALYRMELVEFESADTMAPANGD